MVTTDAVLESVLKGEALPAGSSFSLVYGNPISSSEVSAYMTNDITPLTDYTTSGYTSLAAYNQGQDIKSSGRWMVWVGAVLLIMVTLWYMA